MLIAIAGMAQSMPVRQSFKVNDSLKKVLDENYGAENFSVQAFKQLVIGAQINAVYQHQSSLDTGSEGPISLQVKGDDQLLTTTTLNFLIRFWKKGEFVISPESQLGNGIGNGKGLGAYSNAMYGYPQMAPYILRAHYRHHFYGRKDSKLKEYTITAGRYVLQEMFDMNPYASDPKKDFLNFSHTMLNAWDASVTAYGYTQGIAQALKFKKSAVYLSVNTHNLEAGGSKTDWDVLKAYSINLQYVKDFKLWGQSGKIRLLGFYNSYHGGDFKHYHSDATIHEAHFDSTDAYTTKFGGGIDIHYRLTDNSGFFWRYSLNDGLHEDFGYTQCNASINTGILLKMKIIDRPKDKLGLCGSYNTISLLQQQYLQDGGVGFMVGDGTLTYAPEQVFEAFYAFNFLDHIYLTANYQYIINVAYNAGRGNAHFLGARLNLVL
jgi:high affinity Mn2+ porin